jgi:DNA polymerase-3 subunit beta
MKLNIKKAELLDGLQKASSIIGTKSTLPVLSNVLLDAKSGMLTLTTTDLEVRITINVDAEVETPGVTTLPAKTFLSIIRSLPGSTVDLESDDTHHMSITAGRSFYRLLGLPPDDFPLPIEFTAVRSFSLKQSDLTRTLERISYAASTDDSRKSLSGILFSLKENAFTVVATDGKRLALVERSVDGFTGTDGQSILPAKGALEIQRVFAGGDGEAVVELGEEQVVIKAGGTILSSKLVEGNYPDYRKVIPTSFTRKIELPSEEFSAALQRMSIVVSESSAYVKLTFADNKIEMKAASTEVGEGSESVPIEYTGPEIVVSFNPIYVLAPFRHLDADKVVLQMNDGYNPVALSCGDGFLYVIMPMRSK